MPNTGYDSMLLYDGIFMNSLSLSVHFPAIIPSSREKGRERESESFIVSSETNSAENASLMSTNAINFVIVTCSHCVTCCLLIVQHALYKIIILVGV